MRTQVLFCCFFLFCHGAFAVRISGTISDDKGNILPYASVFVKGSSLGTTSNNLGRYFLELAPGDYTIVCQYVGYTRQEKKLHSAPHQSHLILDCPFNRPVSKK